MSDSGDTSPKIAPAQARPPRQRRNGWVTALLLVTGIVLLLPGVLCAVISIDMGGGFYPDPLTLGVALLAMGGTALIFFAILRGRASPT